MMYSSSEEVDQPDQKDLNDDSHGTGRSYECVFCKRGFTTAQALGGHMNIHRKDRAKKKPTPTTNTLIKNGHFHRPILSYPPSTLSNFAQSYLPASSTSSVRPIYSNPRDFVGDYEKWKASSMIMQFEINRNHHQIRVDEGHDEKGGNEGDELDLELRLGYKP